jgi:hypothetical protein
VPRTGGRLRSSSQTGGGFGISVHVRVEGLERTDAEFKRISRDINGRMRDVMVRVGERQALPQIKARFPTLSESTDRGLAAGAMAGALGCSASGPACSSRPASRSSRTARWAGSTSAASARTTAPAAPAQRSSSPPSTTCGHGSTRTSSTPSCTSSGSSPDGVHHPRPVGALIATVLAGLNTSTTVKAYQRDPGAAGLDRLPAAIVGIPEIQRTGIDLPERELGSNDWLITYPVSIHVALDNTTTAAVLVEEIAEAFIKAIDSFALQIADPTIDDAKVERCEPVLDLTDISRPVLIYECDLAVLKRVTT